MTWFTELLEQKGISADPPPKKKPISLLDLPGRLDKDLVSFGKAGLRDVIELAKSLTTTEGLAGMLDTGTLTGAVAKGGLKSLLGKEANQAVVGVVEKLAGTHLPKMPRVSAVDPARGKQMAQAYEALPKNDPGAKAAYDALNKEVAEQMAAIKKAGYSVEYVDKDPYENSAAMMKDVRENKRLQVYKTQGDQSHPYLTPDQNDQFRAVHDWIAHAGPGNQFGPVGEENAFRMHASTLSPDAQRALATETRGQNSWVNFGPHADKPVKERPFAEQKAALWPEELLGDYADMPAEKVAARSLEAPPAEANPYALPDQNQLKYFRGPRTDPDALNEIYERSRKAFRPKGPYKEYVKAGSKFPGAKMWYDTRGIEKDAADVIGPDAAKKRVGDLMGTFMPASTARSAPPSNLKRGFLWQELSDRGLITPEMLVKNKLVMPEGFGHFAQTTAHQKTLARSLERGSVDPIKNPKPASFGENLNMNWKPGTFDTVMGRIARDIDPELSKFFGKGPDGDGLAPTMWAYEPLERGLADSAHDAVKKGLLEVEDGLAPTAPYQSLGWHGATGSAEYGSMYDIWNRMRDQSAKMWGVTPAKANEMIWKERRVPLLPLDSPLLKGVNPRTKK